MYANKAHYMLVTASPRTPPPTRPYRLTPLTDQVGSTFFEQLYRALTASAKKHGDIQGPTWAPKDAKQ